MLHGTDFERAYFDRTPSSATSTSPLATKRLDEEKILKIVAAAGQPAEPSMSARSVGDPVADFLRNLITFGLCMVSKRAFNLQTYIDAYCVRPHSFGISCVLGALVDFDHSLQCPPLSAHDDQIKLHSYISAMSGGYMRPLVAYNPVADKALAGKVLERVVEAFADQAFVGVKIYPAMGFTPVKPASLFPTLQTFFDTCATHGIPVLAHTEQTNGLDCKHDKNGGPKGWKDLLIEYGAHSKPLPNISFGHFGGDKGNDWTGEFAALMNAYPARRLYGDLGYWDSLLCTGLPKPSVSSCPGFTNTPSCETTRERLKSALAVTLGDGETVADRVLFGTDWFMLARELGWPNYPARLLGALKYIGHETDAEKIFGGNAKKCFPRL
jgi:predicted TIM-barrel fold metal-dependent hydrolase